MFHNCAAELMKKQKTSSTSEKNASSHKHQRKRLDSIAKLYEKLDGKLSELEAKIESSPTLSELPNKPK